MLKEKTKNNKIEINKNFLQIVALSILFLLGMLLGSLIIHNAQSELIQQIKQVVSSFVQNRNEQTYFQILISSLGISICFLVAVLLSMPSVLGMIQIPVVICFRGIGYGIICGYYYMQFGLQGILTCVVCIIPVCAITTVVLIIVSCKCIGFSALITRSLFPNSKPLQLWDSLKQVCSKIWIAIIVILFSSAIEAVVYCTYTKIYELI